MSTDSLPPVSGSREVTGDRAQLREMNGPARIGSHTVDCFTLVERRPPHPGLRNYEHVLENMTIVACKTRDVAKGGERCAALAKLSVEDRSTRQ